MRESLEQAVRAFEDRARPEEAPLAEARRLNRGLRRPSRVQALRPRAFREIFDDAGRHTAGDAERIDCLLAVEAHGDRGAERRAHRPEDARGVETRFVYRFRYDHR